MNETDRAYAAMNTFRTIMELLPHERTHIWSDGGEILCDTESRAEAIADLFDAVFGEQFVVTGYYDPAEDERNNEVTATTGFYYVDIG